MPRFVVPGDFLPPRSRASGGSSGQPRTRERREAQPPALSAPGEEAPRPNPRSRGGLPPHNWGLRLSCRSVLDDSAVGPAFSLEMRKFGVDLVFFNRFSFSFFKPPESYWGRIKERLLTRNSGSSRSWCFILKTKELIVSRF